MAGLPRVVLESLCNVPSQWFLVTAGELSAFVPWCLAVYSQPTMPLLNARPVTVTRLRHAMSEFTARELVS